MVAAQVPWAAHGARHTTAFEVLVAWLVVRMNKSAVKESAAGVVGDGGGVVDRVVARDRARVHPFAGLVRIGIDEIRRSEADRPLWARCG